MPRCLAILTNHWPGGLPACIASFSNIFAIIEPDLFNRCLAEHIGALHPSLKRQIIAIDGKRLRGITVSIPKHAMS